MASTAVPRQLRPGPVRLEIWAVSELTVGFAVLGAVRMGSALFCQRGDRCRRPVRDGAQHTKAGRDGRVGRALTAGEMIREFLDAIRGPIGARLGWWIPSR